MLQEEAMEEAILKIPSKAEVNARKKTKLSMQDCNLTTTKGLVTMHKNH